jgi:hypothetical protein
MRVVVDESIQLKPNKFCVCVCVVKFRFAKIHVCDLVFCFLLTALTNTKLDALGLSVIIGPRQKEFKQGIFEN